MKSFFDRRQHRPQWRHSANYVPLVYILALIFNTSVLADIPAPSPNETTATNVISASSADSVERELKSDPRGDPASGRILISNSKLLIPDTFPTSTEPQEFRAKLEEASQKRLEKDFAAAERILGVLLTNNVPPEVQQSALLEMAQVADEANDLGKAQQLYGEYMKRYSDNPGASEVLLRQGLLYRRMGANVLALSKFYAVLSTVLRLKPDRLEHYQRLVVQAQAEIAETYYLQGKYGEAADFLGRLLKLDATKLQRAQIGYKLIQSLSALGRFPEVIAKAQTFLEQHSNANQVAEVRFLNVEALKKVGRDREAVQQVMALLEGQEQTAQNHPVTWKYWRQRAGNEIANQLYSTGDYINALAIYKSLGNLDSSPDWRLPVWYQMGLVYERLQQPQKAIESYDKILATDKGSASTSTAPSLSIVLEMAKWRKDYLAWLMHAEKSNEKLTPLNSAQTSIVSNDSSPSNH